MNRDNYLNELSRYLKGISEEEKQDILFDYDEHFRIGMEEGRSDEEIIEALGNPKVLAKQLRATILIEKAETKKSASNIFRVVLAATGLGLFNLIFFVGIFFAIAAVIIALIGSGVAVMMGGVGAILSPILSYVLPVSSSFPFVVVVPLGVATAGIGLLIFIGGVVLGRKFYQLTVKYLKMNVNIIKGGENHEKSI